MPIYTCPKEISLTASGTTGEKVACNDDSSDEGEVKNVFIHLYIVTTGCFFYTFQGSYKPTSKVSYKSKRLYQCNECGKVL